jgi:hypothetical protein
VTASRHLARFTAVAAVLLLCGCSQSGGAAVSDASPSGSSPLPPITASTGRADSGATSLASRPAMPLDAYRLKLSEFRAIQRAHATLVNACMARFGFPPAAPPTGPTSGGDEFGTPFPYFIQDARQAMTVGYHSSLLPQFVAETSQLSVAQAASKAFHDSLGARAESYGLVFSGETSTGQPYKGQVGGSALPTGGCVGEASMKLYDSLTPETPGTLANSLASKAWTQSQTQPAVVAAFTAWSGCMARQGFQYKSPAEANNDVRWATATPSTAEITAARADVSCKSQTKLVDTWRAADAAEQKVLIEANASALTEQRQLISDLLQRASGVVNG